MLLKIYSFNSNTAFQNHYKALNFPLHLATRNRQNNRFIKMDKTWLYYVNAVTHIVGVLMLVTVITLALILALWPLFSVSCYA